MWSLYNRENNERVLLLGLHGSIALPLFPWAGHVQFLFHCGKAPAKNCTVSTHADNSLAIWCYFDSCNLSTVPHPHVSDITLVISPYLDQKICLYIILQESSVWMLIQTERFGGMQVYTTRVLLVTIIHFAHTCTCGLLSNIYHFWLVSMYVTNNF